MRCSQIMAIGIWLRTGILFAHCDYTFSSSLSTVWRISFMGASCVEELRADIDRDTEGYCHGTAFNIS